MIGILGGTLGGTLGDTLVCSRANCAAEAQWAILWRNPKIHDESRRKTWLACAEHLDYLRDFLRTRSFPLDVVSVEELEATQ